MPVESVVAFGPGRVNLIGEHTDYNDGLSLPFAITDGITVTARRSGGDEIEVHARDLDEHDSFDPRDPRRAEGWRAFARGAAGELGAAGMTVGGCQLTIEGSVPRGSGLSSSAALEVALCLALIEISGDGPRDRIELARLCSRIENDWAGADTGLLDQIASLMGEPQMALRIDFRTLAVDPVPLRTGEWRLVTVDSGETHSNAESGYNARRGECDAARDALGLASLRDARLEMADTLPDPLDRRVRHVIEENCRVDRMVTALETGDFEAVGVLLDRSHASLRDLYDSSTDAVERTIAGLREAGAAGARMVGGGFGGHVLALFAPGLEPPAGARPVEAGGGGRILARE